MADWGGPIDTMCLCSLTAASRAGVTSKRSDAFTSAPWAIKQLAFATYMRGMDGWMGGCAD